MCECVCVRVFIWVQVCVSYAAGVLCKTNKRMRFRHLNCHAGNSKAKRLFEPNLRQKDLKCMSTSMYNTCIQTDILESFVSPLSNYFIMPIMSFPSTTDTDSLVFCINRPNVLSVRADIVLIKLHYLLKIKALRTFSLYIKEYVTCFFRYSFD